LSIETPLSFDLPSLVKKAVDFENSEPGILPDDLEKNLLPSTSLPQQLNDFELPLTAPTLHPTPLQSHRNKKRALRRTTKVYDKGHTAKDRTLFEHVQLADAVAVKVDLRELPVAKGGYSARHLIADQLDLEKEYTPADLVDLGITILGWDGRYACKIYLNFLSNLINVPRDPRPLVDPHDYVFAVLAGMPADRTYKASTTAIFKQFKAAGQTEAFKAGESIHRRGRFAALPFGISCGNGQKAPARLGTGCHGELVGMLRGSKDLERVANYQDGELGTAGIVICLTH
jgi:hypothetical protein